MTSAIADFDRGTRHSSSSPTPRIMWSIMPSSKDFPGSPSVSGFIGAGNEMSNVVINLAIVVRMLTSASGFPIQLYGPGFL